MAAVTRSIDDGVDLGLLDRRLRDLDHTNARVEVDAYEEAVSKFDEDFEAVNINDDDNLGWDEILDLVWN